MAVYVFIAFSTDTQNRLLDKNEVNEMGSKEKMTEYLQKRDSLKSDQNANTVCRDRLKELLDQDSFVELDSLVMSR